MSGQSLLHYAEALRTGQNLEAAKRHRPQMLQAHRASVLALEDVMPSEHVSQVRNAEQPTKRQPPAKRNLAAERRIRAQEQMRRYSKAETM